MENQNSFLILIIACCLPSFVAIFVLSSFTQIILEYQKAVTVRKKWSGDTVINVHNPGFLFVNRFTTRLYRVDIREKVKNTEVMAVSHPDNTKIKIQTEWAYRIVDPIKSISVVTIELAVEGMATVTLREIVENMSIESIKKYQLQIEQKWRDRLNDLTENKWGAKISHVEIQKITRISLEVV